MNALVRYRWLPVLLCVGALAGFAGDCTAQSRTQGVALDTVPTTLGELDQDPDRIVRVVVKVKPGTARQVAAAARDAGANAVNPLFGAESVVIEGNAAQVRAAVGTGQVLQIRRDTSPPTE